jgi:hypothetical protein
MDPSQPPSAQLPNTYITSEANKCRRRTKKGSPRIAGAWALAFGLAGSASPLLSTLGRCAMRPWCPPSLLRHVLRVRKGKPLRGHVHIGLRPLHLCGTRSEGGHQGLSRRCAQWEGEPLGRCGRRSWSSLQSCWRIHFGSVSAFFAAALTHADDRDLRAGAERLATPTNQQPRRSCFIGSTARTSGLGRVFGAHPRGEFPTSGAAVGQ